MNVYTFKEKDGECVEYHIFAESEDEATSKPHDRFELACADDDTLGCPHETELFGSREEAVRLHG